MFKNRMFWHSIGTLYIAAGVTVLAQRAWSVAISDLKDTAEVQKRLNENKLSNKAA